MKINIIRSEKQQFRDGTIMFKLIGSVFGDEVENPGQLISFYSQKDAQQNHEYDLHVYISNDMKTVKLRLGNEVIKK